MAPAKEKKDNPKKRKQTKPDPDRSGSKKPKLSTSKPDINKNKTESHVKKKQTLRKPFKKTQDISNEKGSISKREGRIRAKELAEARKKKRKRHYTLEQDLTRLWEKMRQRNISKEERSKLITEALEKMKGKIPEIASSHVSSRVLQTCVKYCSQVERDSVFLQLKPHFLTFACNTYAVHLVKKMLDNASKPQLAQFISALQGHVASLLRHMVGSVVVEHVYQLGNATQKQELLVELFSTELQLFKDLASLKERRLIDVISKLKLQKGSVLRHMASVIQPILEKGIVDHSIIHRLLVEYLSMADKISAAEIIKQLSGPLLVRMIHTRDGSKIGILCVKHGSAKERKKIVKGMKDHIVKITHDQYGSLVLSCILSTVDDTKLLTKIVIKELQTSLNELVFEKNGRRPILQLLHPNSSRYFSPDDISSLDLSIPSLSSKAELEEKSETQPIKADESSNMEDDQSKEIAMTDPDEGADNLHSFEGGKKDPSVRRQELLIESGLAKKLIGICIENLGDFLRSNFGKEVLYELATGGSGGILLQTLEDEVNSLLEAIADLAAEPKSEESESEHILENFHSSRTIRKLVMDSPPFATKLWKKAFKGKCGSWAQGHSSKVLCAFLESPDEKVSELTKKELQPLIEGGILKLPESKQLAN